MTSAPDCQELDEANPAAATRELEPLFEGAPRFLARVVADRPFGTWDRLFERAREIAHGMPEAEQVELVNAHPRLGAAPASVSAASFREQGYDRHPDFSEPPNGAQPPTGSAQPRTGSEHLEALNDAYEARFGFRYCVFVAGRPLDALAPELEAALGADRQAELHRAIDAVVDIARARHDAIQVTAA